MEVFLGIFLTLIIFQSIILVIRKRQRKAVDAAYKRGLEDAKQASKEVIKDIKIKVSEGKPFHVAANEIANEMKRLLDERKGAI